MEFTNVLALWALGAVQQHYLITIEAAQSGRDLSIPVGALVVFFWPIVTLYIVVLSVVSGSQDNDDDGDDEIEPDDDDLEPQAAEE